MKAIVSISCYEFLLPDETTAAKLVALLGKAIQVRDHSYEGFIDVEPEHPAEIAMRIIAKPVKFVDRAGNAAPQKPARAIRPGREMKGSKQLLLTTSGQRRPI